MLFGLNLQPTIFGGKPGLLALQETKDNCLLITFLSDFIGLSQVLLTHVFSKLVSPNLGYPQIEAATPSSYIKHSSPLQPTSSPAATNVSMSNALCWDKGSPPGLLAGAVLLMENLKVCLF